MARRIGARAGSHGVLAQDANNGHALFTLNCSPCHGSAQQNVFGVLAGANPDVILSEIQAYAPMRFLAPNPNGPITSVGQIDDIAAYLAQAAGGGGGGGGMLPTPAFGASPPGVGFGNIAVGAVSAPATFTITVANANGTVAGVGSGNPAEFHLTGGTCLRCPTSLPRARMHGAGDVRAGGKWLARRHADDQRCGAQPGHRVAERQRGARKTDPAPK